MCFGEGIHADCVDRDRVMNSKQKIVWPAGDDLEEDEVEEVNQCGNFRIFAKFRAVLIFGVDNETGRINLGHFSNFLIVRFSIYSFISITNHLY